MDIFKVVEGTSAHQRLDCFLANALVAYPGEKIRVTLERPVGVSLCHYGLYDGFAHASYAAKTETNLSLFVNLDFDLD